MKRHDVICKLVAVALAVKGLLVFVEAFDASGLFGLLAGMAAGVFLICTGVGFWRYRGWAFLAWSVLLLGGFFYTLVTLVLAIDTKEGVMTHVALFVANIALIGYFGRWGMERRFRPHLDVETEHHHHADDHGHAEPAAT